MNFQIPGNRCHCSSEFRESREFILKIIICSEGSGRIPISNEFRFQISIPVPINFHSSSRASSIVPLPTIEPKAKAEGRYHPSFRRRSGHRPTCRHKKAALKTIHCSIPPREAVWIVETSIGAGGQTATRGQIRPAVH